MNFRLVIIFFLLTVAAGPATAGTVTLAGSGGMIPLLTELGKAYMERHPSDIVRVNPQSLTQSGGILAAKNGTIDIGMSARNLTEAEKNGDVEVYLISKVAAEIAVHRSVPVKNLTSQQICDIYAGKIRNWREVGGNDSEIVVLTKPDIDSTKQALMLMQVHQV
jgi:phosphate transport system substrate-binding protein